MTKKIFSQRSACILTLCLLLISCKKKDVGVKPNSGLYVIHSPAPKPTKNDCDGQPAPSIDTNAFKRIPLFGEMAVIDRGIGAGNTEDYSDTTFRCDSWNMNGGSNIYRSFFGLPDFSSLSKCTKIKKANVWIHSGRKSDYYVDNPTDSIQLLLTVWPKDSIDRIKWLHIPACYTNTLSVSNKPYQHDAWICFDVTYVVQSIIEKKYPNNLFIMRTSKENMFIPYSRQKNLMGTKSKRQSLRPYFEIIF